MAHENLNALFVGGFISAGQLLDLTWTSGAAQVSRLELVNNTWLWSKVMIRKSDDASLLTVTALAVDNNGKRVAAYGTKPEATDFENSFIFILDAATGEIEFDLHALKSDLAKSDVFSSGMLL